MTELEATDKPSAINALEKLRLPRERKKPSGVIVLEPPAESDLGNYILAIYKESGPFGGSGTIMYAIDELLLVLAEVGVDKKLGVYYQGFYDDGKGNKILRVQFPAHNDYMMFERSQARSLSQEEYREERKKSIAEWKEQMKEQMAGEGAQLEDDNPPGRFTYL